MQKNGLDTLYQEYNEGKLSHAFLLETNNQDLCLNSLLTFLGEIDNDEKIKKMIMNETLPSLIVIRPDGSSIKKEQVLSLKKQFLTKPIFSKYNMYIVLNAECLNASSANTILKFLEEPEDDILGFFITNNKENIIETIKSRCQIVLDYYDNVSNINIPEEWKYVAINYIKEYECVHDEAVFYNKNVLLPLIKSRGDLTYLFQSVFLIYHDFYLCNVDNRNISDNYSDLQFLVNRDGDYLHKQLDYVGNLLDELNYNVNTQLFLDRFVLEGR